ncbi:MAG: hypothetical protein ABS79_06680 [Planctomycetes bacterium SCN 63-9]|nr:MAG: hypothetical protein ABS79_06680 [Planctomycetes bacterium SCN 63-9]
MRNSLAQPDATAEPNASGWNQFFDALLQDLAAYAKAGNEGERLVALNRIYEMSQALGTSGWEPAWKIRESLREWMRPRVRLAWAQRQLTETVEHFPETAESDVKANRRRWIDFAQNDLGSALRAYEEATTVARRLDATKRVREAIKALNRSNAQYPWQVSQNLEQAVNDLYNRPNLDVSADLATVTPLFNANLVTTGPVERKGYISQVTAGPKTGFGLMPSDDSIAFYNRQLFTSVTPVWDFQNQIAADPQGQRAAQLYQFSATSQDQAELTVTTQITTTGLVLTPSYTHAIDAQICSVPTEGNGGKRLIAGLVGMNQSKITEKVREGALPKFQQQIPAEAMEEAQQRIGAEAYQRNSDLFWKYLKGNNTLTFNNLVINQLSFRSRPEAAYIGGLLHWQQSETRGADAPQPSQFQTFESGVTADVHIGSILTSLAEAAYQRDDVKDVQNVMVVTHNVPAGSPPAEAFTLTKNVDFPTYEKAADKVRAAKDPKVTAIRLTKPSQAPAVSADARGNLVAIIKDVEFDLLVPEGTDRVTGVKAKIFRITMPEVEVAFAYELKPATPDAEARVAARIVEFTPAPASKIIAVTEENKEQQLAQFTKVIVLAGMGGKLRSIPIDVPLSKLDLKGFAVQSLSKPHPSGWMRVNLVKVEGPTPSPAVTTPPAHGPETPEPPMPGVSAAVPAPQPSAVVAAP